MYNHFLDAEKTLEILVFLSKDTHDLFHLMKVLYYAEKLHFERFGTSMAEDYFVAMPEGPVPSGAYDILKECRGDGNKFDERITNLDIKNSIYAKNTTTFIPLRQPNVDLLSDSNVEVLTEANKTYGHMDPKELWDQIHDEKAYKATKENEPITDREMITQLSNGTEIYEYLTN